MSKYLIIHRRALRHDSWTYGEFRQFVAFRDDGSACLVRMSQWPLFLAFFGAAVLILLAFAVVTSAMGLIWPVMWDRVALLSFVGFALVGPEVVQWLTGWRLTVIVGKVTRREDGSYYRVLGSDE